MCVWQSEERRCAVVLGEVFAWLAARELARAGAACRAWRRAAAAPALWRALLRRLAPDALLDLHQHYAPGAVPWRQEYVVLAAGWRLRARHRAPAALLHAALAPAGDLLALCAADASLAVWREADGAWGELSRTELRWRGWASAARALWPARARRLLLAGPLALVDHWELIVLRIQEDGSCGSVESRVRCSAGAAGCWADLAGDAFLSFELRRLGAGLYCTTVWLNAATQETQSEYVGVTSPLLSVYNEEGAHLTHALVCAAAGGQRALLAGGGRRLGAWALADPRPPPLLVGTAGELAERVRRQRRRRAEPAEDAAEPDEASVRAWCTAPAHAVSLDAPLVDLLLHERSGCVWALCADGGAACLSPALGVLRRVRAPPGPRAPPAHHVQGAARGALLAWPAGAYSGRVWCCAGAALARGAAPAHGAAALACVLTRARRPDLLVLAGDELYVWRSRATPQCDARDYE